MAAIINEIREASLTGRGASGLREKFFHLDPNGASTVEVPTGMSRIFGFGFGPIGATGGTSALSLNEAVGTAAKELSISGSTATFAIHGTSTEFFLRITGY